MLRWTTFGKEYGADPCQVNIILMQLNIADCKHVVGPGTKDARRTREADRKAMDAGVSHIGCQGERSVP